MTSQLSEQTLGAVYQLAKALTYNKSDIKAMQCYGELPTHLADVAEDFKEEIQSQNKRPVRIGEYTILANILKTLRQIEDRESKRHQMDCHLTPVMNNVLDELIVLLDEALNWEPSDEDLGVGSDAAPLSADERYEIARQEKMKAKG